MDHNPPEHKPRLWHRIAARMAHSKSPDKVLAGIIRLTAEHPGTWEKPDTQERVNWAVEQGANINKALDVALGKNIEAAQQLLGMGAAPSTEGLARLACAAEQWWQDVCDDWGDFDYDDQWKEEELARKLVELYPRHEAWAKQVPGRNYRIIGQITQSTNGLMSFYLEKSGISPDEEAGDILNWFDPLRDILYLIDGKLGKGGERISSSVQRVLLDEATKRRPELFGDTNLIEWALECKSWYFVDLWREKNVSIPSDILVKSIAKLTVELNTNDVGLDLEEGQEMDRFLGILAEDLDMNLDLDNTIKVQLGFFDNDNEVEDWEYSIRHILGRGAAIVEAGLRRRKLMDQYGSTIDQLQEQEMGEPISRQARPKM